MKRKIASKKRNAGMTLTEVMVAFAIISIVSLFMASGFLAAAAYIRRGIDTQTASAEAAALAEQSFANTPGNECRIEMYSGSKLVGAYDGSVYSSTQAVNEVDVEYSVFVTD